MAESDELINSQNGQATQTAQEMPKYRCHKEVSALKIKAIRPNAVHEVGLDTGSCLLEVEEPYFAPVFVTADYMRKHDPQPGGYFVVYEDGYKSFSPAKAFEEGYTRI